jgi:hypothetical protein
VIHNSGFKHGYCKNVISAPRIPAIAVIAAAFGRIYRTEK